MNVQHSVHLYVLSFPFSMKLKQPYSVESSRSDIVQDNFHRFKQLRHLINIGREPFPPEEIKKYNCESQMVGFRRCIFYYSKILFFRHDKAKNSIRGTLNLKRSQITVASGSVRFYLPPESHHIATPSYLGCMCGCVSAVCFKRNLTHPSCEAQTSVQDAFLKKGQTRQEGFKTS